MDGEKRPASATNVILEANRRQPVTRGGSLARLLRAIRYAPVLLVLLVGIAFSAALYFLADEWQEQRMRGRFEEDVRHIASRLERSFLSDQEVLNSIRALYAASYSVERQEFATFVAGALSRYPHIQALDWIPYVPRPERATYEEAARADGYPEFQFTERDSQRSLMRAGDRQAHFPVYYVEPFLGNETALGYDLGSDDERLKALERARDTGTFAATARITLVQETGRQFGFLLFLPIYRNGAPQNTVEERRAALVGFASAVFRLGDFAEHSLDHHDDGSYAVRLVDNSAPRGRGLLYESPNADGDNGDRESIAADIYETVEFDVGGRRWSLLVYPKSGQLRGQETPMAPGALAAGLLITLALAAYLTTALRHRYELSRSNAALRVEISERERAEEALRAREESYRTLLETSPDAIVFADLGARIRYCNRQAAKLLGYHNATDVLGKSAFDLVQPPDSQDNTDYLKVVLERGSVANVERNLIRRDGVLVPVEISGSLVADGKGKPQGFLAVMRDITERKQTEEVFKTVYEHSPVSIYIVQNGKLQFVNDQVLKQTGYGRAELLGADCLGLVLPQDRPVVRENAVGMLKGKRLAPYEYRVLNKSGEARWVLETVTPVNFKGERAALGEFIDITEHKKVEEEAERWRQDWENIFQSISDQVLILDTDHRVIEANRSVVVTLGKSREDVIGKRCYELFHGTDRAPAGCPMQKLLQSTRRERSEMRVEHLGGTFLVSCTPVLDAGGRVDRVIHFATDITDRIRAQEELQESLAKLRTTLEGTIEAMALTVAIRDPYTAGHERRVAELASAIAAEMGLSDERISVLRMAGLIHDIGKIGVPADILSKPGRINDYEYSLIKAHASLAYDILKTVPFPWPIANIVLQHHEMMDGSGYPSGLKGDEILFEARILAVADVVEAMASHRPYRPALSIEEALAEISRNRGIRFDANVVDACLRVFARNEVEFAQSSRELVSSAVLFD